MRKGEKEKQEEMKCVVRRALKEFDWATERLRDLAKGLEGSVRGALCGVR